MTITAEMIVEIGKVVSALIVVVGIPIGAYKIVKKWNNNLFQKIEVMGEKIDNLKAEVENMKIESNKKFNELNDSIKDIRSTNRTFYNVLNTIIDVLYKKDPNTELDNVKKQISDELIKKATKEE